MAKIICGPVVGLVSTNTANVLLEVDESVSVEMCLKDSSTGHTERVTVKLTGKVPGMFLFKSLDSDSTYHITVPSLTGDKVLGRVRTFPDDVKTVGIGVASCDRPESTTTDTWEYFYQRATEDEIHVVLHIGDNVYMDGESFADHSTPELVNSDDHLDKVKTPNPYINARRILAGLPRDQWASKRDDILQIYRGRYREVFSGRNKAKVLANFSNLMILDDHDIRDDFGCSPLDSDPESKEFFLGSIGLQTYHEYQRQLWDPDVFEKADKLTSEFYKIQVGPLKIMMVDSRMTRSIYKRRRPEGDESYYGKDQYDVILSNLKPDGRTRFCVMTYPMPMFFLKRKIIEIAEKMGGVNDDITEFINNNHSSEIEPILEAIENFKQELGPKGDVVMFAGDIHIGGFTDIYKKRPGKDLLVCHQITSSAINNRNVKLSSFKALRGIMNFVDSYGDYTYKHFDWTKEPNFALLTADFGDPDELMYHVKLIDRKNTELRMSSDPDWDKGLTTVTSQCCGIL